MSDPVFWGLAAAALFLQAGADLIGLLSEIGPLAALVLVILLLMSIASWGVILSKWLLFRKVRRETETFWRMYKKAKGLSEVAAASESLRFTPLVDLLDIGTEMLENRVPPATLERSVSRAAVGRLSELEHRMTFLATTASVAPFIGLFGTVMGVIGSFVGLSTAEAGASTLASVGGGIAEALIATGVGLFAAIPSLVAYNYFVGELKYVGAQMDDLMAEFLAIAETGE